MNTRKTVVYYATNNTDVGKIKAQLLVILYLQL